MIPRGEGYEQPLYKLEEALTGEQATGYMRDFENEIFMTHPDCQGCKAECAWCDGSGTPNFHYKPTDLKIWWYKYILRGGEINQEITVEQLYEIVNLCIGSIK